MAATLSLEQNASFAVIIDRILGESDLQTISAKRIRKGLQDEVGYDLSEQKTAITNLIMERFDKAQQKPAGQNGTTSGAVEPAPTANGTIKAERPSTNGGSASPPASMNKRKAESTEMSEVEDDSPAPKKIKKSGKVETDAQLAARLQAELNALQRSTRGGGSKRKAPAKKEKKAKKKSSAKVNSDDDSEVEGGEKPEKERKGGFHKPMALSEPLVAMLGETQLSRPQTVKKIWEYIKANDLQNPSDKREIMCDETMRAVFKQDKVHMFTMNKLLATQLYPVEDI